MAITYVKGFIFLVCASTILELAVSFPAKNWQYGFNYTDWVLNHGVNKNLNSSTNSTTNSPRKIVVGGSNQWQFGVNYTDWVLNNGPFYLHDTLVFKYDAPNENNTHPHSVYLLPNLWSFKKCDMSKARMIANVSDGEGEGFEFELNRWQPYYFACGESNGFHCTSGGMKFSIMPLLRGWRY